MTSIQIITKISLESPRCKKKMYSPGSTQLKTISQTPKSTSRDLKSLLAYLWSLPQFAMVILVSLRAIQTVVHIAVNYYNSNLYWLILKVKKKTKKTVQLNKTWRSIWLWSSAILGEAVTFLFQSRTNYPWFKYICLVSLRPGINLFELFFFERDQGRRNLPHKLIQLYLPADQMRLSFCSRWQWFSFLHWCIFLEWA